MTGSNSETEERGEIILSRETNILLAVNQSEGRKQESGIAAETVYVGRILLFVFFRPGKPSWLQLVRNMTENGFENSGLIHHELRNGMYFFRVSCAVKMSGILVVCT